MLFEFLIFYFCFSNCFVRLYEKDSINKFNNEFKTNLNTFNIWVVINVNGVLLDSHEKVFFIYDTKTKEKRFVFLIN